SMCASPLFSCPNYRCSFPTPCPHRLLHSFPTTTLFRSTTGHHPSATWWSQRVPAAHRGVRRCAPPSCSAGNTCRPADRRRGADRDRKSTRLNSSHVKISYAVFCLKKKITTLLPKQDSET